MVSMLKRTIGPRRDMLNLNISRRSSVLVYNEEKKTLLA